MHLLISQTVFCDQKLDVQLDFVLHQSKFEAMI